VIPKDFITEWRDRAPWAMDRQVEQDLVISRALVELFSRKPIAEALAFRGGTALYKLHMKPAARYSEDIDLVQTSTARPKFVPVSGRGIPAGFVTPRLQDKSLRPRRASPVGRRDQNQARTSGARY
jgi:hypothetical protein